MKVLLGYTRCPFTREAFERHGNDVWTCDLLPTAEGHPKHLQCDIWEVANDNWDMAVLHPMCTYLTVSAAWAFADPDFGRYPGVGYHQKVKQGTLTGEARREALENFARLLNLPYPKAVENPAPSFVSEAIRPPDQTIHPHQFGDDASKRTGLWLDRLPRLRPTAFARPRPIEAIDTDLLGDPVIMRWGNQTDSGQNKLSPGEERWLERSATFPGIARAFGDQWGGGDWARRAFA